MSQNDQPHLSLLSLSIAAASAAPIPATATSESAPRSLQGTATHTVTKHRRLSSTGRSRRRLSDARDAATRPFPASLQTASASLAALSLSSPTVSHRTVHGAQPIQVPPARSANGTSKPNPADVDDAHLSVSPQSRPPLAPNSVNVAKPGRKRGTIFTCESCSKVYRHPSCLIKHRWEHTPQWREASKFVLSKHQQVQLLEAAAILSHLSPSSASLPEDRSLWPSFLSGGLVPPPASALNDNGQTTSTATPSSLVSVSASVPSAHTHASFPISSSVPASTVLGSHDAGATEPRLHDYAVGGDGSGITHVRPGVVSVPTAPMPVRKGGSSPMPVPVPALQGEMRATTTKEDDALNLLALRSGSASVASESWMSPTSPSHGHSRSHARSFSYSHARSHSHSSHAWKEPGGRVRRQSNAYEYAFGTRRGSHSNGVSGYTCVPALHENGGGWSLPRSSVRSKSGSSGSRSQSASESRSDDEEDGVLAEVLGVDDEEDGEDLEGGDDETAKAAVMRGWAYGSRLRTWDTTVGEQDGASESAGRGTERTWDGMEMEMDMD